MASMELERSSETVEEVEEKRAEMDSGKVKKAPNKKKRRKSLAVPRLGCFRSDDGYPTVEKSYGGKSFDMESACTGKDRAPTHLVIMANGLIGSSRNWRFAAKQFLKKYPQDVIAHCSKCNPPMLTFDGVDVMGKRLADEVISVIKRHPGLQKISFIGHSLGGLVARYAIAILYGQDFKSKENGECRIDGSIDPCTEEEMRGKIAGLEPMNFITFATPHLGSKGHKQVPAFCGVYNLEKAASRTSWFLGRTGKHLFLTDTNDGKPPLLLRMTNDCDDLQFMSALQSFKRRVAYANVRFDPLVGWSTASLRRQNKLPKRQHLSRHDKYPHIVNVEAATQEEVPLEAQANGYENDDIKEKMIRALTKLSWERVDVNFKGSKQRYFAHSTIQVKTYFINSDGADVIQHMVDNFLL